jgi:hypothetical protein
LGPVRLAPFIDLTEYSEAGQDLMDELNQWNDSLVARELGNPAVIGCGNATAILKTGDRVRADGGQGIVEVLTDG